MNDQGGQFGSFGSVSPDDMENIRRALERRGMGDSVGALMQQSGASATPAPQLPPDINASMGGGVPMPTGGELAAPAPEQVPQGISGAGAMPGSPEAELILKAMTDRLKHLSKVEEAQNQPQTQF